MENTTKREAALLSEFANLMNRGFPEREMAQYEEKLKALPNESRQKVEELNEFQRTLKSALRHEGPDRR